MPACRTSAHVHIAGRALRAAIGCVLALGLLACSVSENEAVSPFHGTGIGISTEDIDTATDPGNDFYRYANGNWLVATRIPDDANFLARSMKANAELDRRLATIVEDIAGRPQDDGTPEAVVRDYYRLFMDRRTINEQGIAPALGDIRRFQSIDDVAMLSRVIGGTLRADANPFINAKAKSENLFAVAAMPAPDDGVIIPWLLQGGLGIPDSSVYLTDSASARADRAAYRDLMARTLTLAGMENATARADAILALESKIAAAHGLSVSRREMLGGAVAWSRNELALNAPGLEWDELLRAAGLTDADRFAMFHPEAIRRLSALAASEPLDTWRDWLVFHRLNSHADVLPDEFGRAHFAFYDRRLGGQTRMPSSEQQVFGQIGLLFSDTLSRHYAERYFSSEEKRDVAIIAERVRQAMIAQVKADADLGDRARKEAVLKLESMDIGVGYPERFSEIPRLRSVGENIYAKTIAAERALYSREVSAIGQPMDLSRWEIGAHRIAVTNFPLHNAMTIPAAILQPPFYDPEADAAANYGTIGTIIGREMSRAIDPNGAMIDSAGRITDWLSPEDRAILDMRGNRLAAQSSSYRDAGDLAPSGDRTWEEDFCDLAGLVAAHDAYRASLDGREPKVMEGFTGDQRFFIAFAQIWAFKIRDSSARLWIERGDYALPPYRVSAVRNLDAWYRAFDVQQSDALYLPVNERVRLY